jgi:G3E family GTPase
MNYSMTTPLTILTGFLGAGKTTLLNRIIHAEHGLKLAVLVNDFGSVNIDAAAVAATSVDGNTVSLSNGCICCTIRGDLLQAVEDVLAPDAAPVDAVIIETSGVSDPLEVAMTFRDVPRMQALVHIDSIVAVLDAEQFPTLEREYAVLAMNQIGVADLVVLNKMDLVDDDQREQVRKAAQRIMPKARLFETSHADVPLELLLGVGRYDIAQLGDRDGLNVHVHERGEIHDHHDHTDHTTVFETWTWTSVKPLSANAIKRVLDNLPTGIYRLKGQLYIEGEAQAVTVHVAGTRVTLTDGAPFDGIPLSQVVAIGAAGRVDEHALTAQFDAALAENAPRSELGRWAQQVRSWLRST